jgi:hypothetical protein
MKQPHEPLVPLLSLWLIALTILVLWLFIKAVM